MLPYFICLFLLVLPGGTENSIEFKIEISKSGFPTISMDIGNQKSRKLLLSLYSPMIIAFPYQNLSAHYEKANSSTYKSLDITAQFPNINAAQEDYKVMKTHPVEGKRLLEQLPKIGAISLFVNFEGITAALSTKA